MVLSGDFTSYACGFCAKTADEANVKNNMRNPQKPIFILSKAGIVSVVDAELFISAFRFVDQYV
jgi:hypothetical protein